MRLDRRGLSAFAALLAGVTAAASGASAQNAANPDPGTIYDKARSVWRAERYVPLLRYRVVVRYRVDGKTITDTHEGLWERDTGGIFIKAISDEERDNEYTPHGSNLFGVNNEFFEPFGVPELSPVYSFGLASPPHVLVPEPDEPTPEPSGLREIGSIAVVARDYRLTYLGVEPCSDGTQAHHLGLMPRGKRSLYRLRQLWVRKSDGTTCRLRVQNNFESSPIGTGAWEVNYVESPGIGTTIAEEHPLVPLTFRKKTIDDARISFEGLESARDDVNITLWKLGLSSTRGETTFEPGEP